MKRNLNQLIKLSILGLFGIAIFVSSCKKDNPIEVTETKFIIDASSTQITVEDTINYADLSKDVANRTWNFQGGNVTSSEEEALMIIYPDTGRFETTLLVEFTDGTSEDRLIYVEVEPFVDANFAASATTVVFGSNVTFNNTTLHMPAVNSFEDSPSFEQEQETWLWEFEGGVPATSTEENPVVRYSTLGTYSVKLTANRNYPKHSDAESKTAYINVVDVAVISPEAVHTCDFGSTIRVTFAEALEVLPANAVDAFSVMADGMPIDVSSIESDVNNDMSLIISLATPVADGQAVSLNYDPNVSLLTAQSGSIFAPLPDFLVENRVSNVMTGNVDFELGAVGEFPNDWGTWNQTASINNPEEYRVVDDEQAPSGINSVKWTYDGSEDVWILDNKTPAPITVGGIYKVVYNAKSSLDGAVLDIRVIEDGWATSNNPADAVLTTEWAEYSFEFTADEGGGNNRRIWWQTPPNTEVFDMHVDNVRMYYLGCD